MVDESEGVVDLDRRPASGGLPDRHPRPRAAASSWSSRSIADARIVGWPRRCLATAQGRCTPGARASPAPSRVGRSSAKDKSRIRHLPSACEARPGWRRLASGPRRQRQPDRPSLRLLAADRLSLAGPLRPHPPRDARGSRVGPASPASADLDDRAAPRGQGHPDDAIRAGARTSSSSCSVGRASRCRARWSAGSWPGCGARASCTSRGGAGWASASAAGRDPMRSGRPGDWVVSRPGDLVELDTLDIRPLPGTVWKQFTARDVVSRWDVVELGRRATAAGGGRGPRSAGRADAVRRPGDQHRQRLRVHGRVRSRLCRAGHPAVRPAPALAQAPWRGRAGQPDPHRGVLRGDQRRTRARDLPGRAPAPGRRCTTRSVPTSRSATSPRPNTWPPSAVEV